MTMTNVVTLNTRKSRGTSMVTAAELEALLNLIKEATNATEEEIMGMVGYTGSAASAWRNRGEGTLRTKYALLGLIAELKVPTPPPPPAVKPIQQFKKLELFSILALVSATPPGERASPSRQTLIVRIAEEMGKAAE